MRSLLFFSVALAVCHFIYAQDDAQKYITEMIYLDNTSQDGIPGQSYILMHNRKGVRIEYNLNKQQLNLWISPLAGKSMAEVDRNFSNRDDNTSIFDKIAFPHLKFKDFISCEYDAFYSKIIFKNNTMHILSVYDKPAVVVWFDKSETIDFKTDKIDHALIYTPHLLLTRHSERGKHFDFAAKVANGKGTFVHQKVYDPMRSFYSRVTLQANQPVVIAGDEYTEGIAAMVDELSNTPIKDVLSKNEKLISADIQYGTIKVRNNPDLQKIIDLNKRIILSMQDESGAIRAALRYIYYLIWHRDGGMVFSYNAYTGWAAPLKKWCEFIMANPTVNNKGERFFGQLVSPITKLEEDGPFYGIWSMYTYWSQTGDTSLLTSANLALLDDNIKWLENNYFDSEKGMFFRYHYGESPYYGSYGDGWDDAVGRQSFKNPYKWKGDTITKAFDTYINTINYANYIMLSVLNKGEKSQLYLAKAQALAAKLMPYFMVENGLPAYGELITVKGKSILAEGSGPDEADYQWGFGLPPFQPHYSFLESIRENITQGQLVHPKGQFLSSMFSNVASLDPEVHGADKIIKAIEYVIPQTTATGKCLPMPYTIPEIVDVEDCNLYHDVRPQPFSVSAYFAAISNLGVKRLPLGVAVRANEYISSIQKYQYQGGMIDFLFAGKGNYVATVKVNGKNLVGSLQIPENRFTGKQTKVEVTATAKPYTGPILMGSTIKLLDVNKNTYKVEASGKNVLMFKNLPPTIKVTNTSNYSISTIKYSNKGVDYLEFEGNGIYLVSY